MGNQSGKIILVGVFSLVIAVIISLLLINANGNKEKSSALLPTNLLQSPSLTTIVLPSPSGKIECMSDDAAEKSAWDLLPRDLKGRTAIKGVNSPGSSTYELYLHKWSSDCRFLPFQTELIGRGGGAYTSEDYRLRALYLYDSNDNKLVKIMDIPEKLLFESGDVYSSDFWESNSVYKFVLSETEKLGRFQKVRYSFDTTDSTLSVAVEEN